MNANDLAIVLPTRGRPEILARTLAGLRTQTEKGAQLIIVVDGEDQPAPAVDDALILVQAHRGPGAARNRGVRATSRPLVLFMGDDMLPAPDLLAWHLEAHRRHPAEEDAVLGRVEWHPEVRLNGLVRWLDRMGMQFDTTGLDAPDVEVGWQRFTTGNVSLKRKLFEKAGGFDEDFFFLHEDIELGLRLGRCGLKLRYEPRARCFHLHNYNLESYRQRMVALGKTERLMTLKHPSFAPWFRPQVLKAMQAPRATRLWPLLVDRVPSRPGWLREHAESTATMWYLQKGAPAFFENWEGEEDLEELRAYLGDSFDARKLAGHKDEMLREQAQAADEGEFYRTSEAYLYELTMFGFWQVKTPYLMDILTAAPPPVRVLDYGCGIGTDGLRLHRLGYTVAFADFDNPSTKYLRWRLQRRGIDAPVFDVDTDVPSGHDLVFSFDVIEHVEDPWAFLDRLERLGGIVAVNLLEPEPEDDPNELHRPLPIPSILDHAARRGLLRYRRYHGRSHLIIYRGYGPRRRSRVSSHVERRLGPLWSKVEGG